MKKEIILHELERLPIGHPPGSQPISPRAHGLLDYVLATFLVLAPRLLGLTGTTAAVARTYGVTQLALNALTDHPVAASPEIPFRAHGVLEKWTAPAAAVFALLTGGTRRENLPFLVGYTILGATIFSLTDWNHPEPVRDHLPKPK